MAIAALKNEEMNNLVNSKYWDQLVELSMTDPIVMVHLQGLEYHHFKSTDCLMSMVLHLAQQNKNLMSLLIKKAKEEVPPGYIVLKD